MSLTPRRTAASGGREGRRSLSLVLGPVSISPKPAQPAWATLLLCAGGPGCLEQAAWWGCLLGSAVQCQILRWWQPAFCDPPEMEIATLLGGLDPDIENHCLLEYINVILVSPLPVVSPAPHTLIMPLDRLMLDSPGWLVAFSSVGHQPSVSSSVAVGWSWSYFLYMVKTQ